MELQKFDIGEAVEDADGVRWFVVKRPMQSDVSVHLRRHHAGPSHSIYSYRDTFAFRNAVKKAA